MATATPPDIDAAKVEVIDAAANNGTQMEKSDSEEEKAACPEELYAEEQRLMEERRAAQEQATAQGTANLTENKYKQLDQLLDQTNLYSKFLSEQMESLEEEEAGLAGKGDEEEEEEEEEAAKGKRKKKGAKRKAKPEKKKKSATLEMLPLVTGGELRAYQLKGVRWLVSLYQNGLNGILADQMGLGKTVQVVSFLSHLRSKGVLGPYLVIGPLSTLPNWVNEFKRWTPDVPVLLYHGSQAERADLRRKHMPTGACDEKFPVVCTSYEIVIRDRKFLQNYVWKYLVVDEGHRLKNFDCMLIRELKQIRTNNKLLLSGTPLQNNLAELWSLLHFILPDVFSNLDQFQSWFDFSGVAAAADASVAEKEAQRRELVVKKLHSILKPFLLRRIKSDVETNLPRKKEIVLYASMSETQQTVGKALVERSLGDLLSKVNSGMPVKAPPQINNVLMQLRKNCNHPDLVTSQVDGSLEYPSAEELVEQCGKFQLMDRLLTRLKARGHKVLIFSQMTRMLDLIAIYLESKGETPFRIDGTVPWQERQENMNLFNNDPNYFVFLLSTRAGGLGINLVAADTVIIYDSDWNPHQDLQAMDRCHRIGQRRPVHVYRLATAHSVEGRMLARANEKLKLEKVIITGGNFRQDESGSSLSVNDILHLITDDDAADGLAQSADISDSDLDMMMDRDDLEGKKAAPPTVGPGWEVIAEGGSSNLLSGVE